MNPENPLSPADPASSASQPSTDPLQPDQPTAVENTLQAKVVAPKAMLHEIKTLNKAGRPVMRIHEPRQRFKTGEVLHVFPDEIVADGGVIYLLCADHPDMYVRKIDLALPEE